MPGHSSRELRRARKRLSEYFPRLEAVADTRFSAASTSDDSRGAEGILVEEDEGNVTVLEREQTRPGLFDYQSELVDEIVERWECGPQDFLGLVSLPTGGGKTRVGLMAVLKLLAMRKISCVLWLAATKELLDQAASSAEALWLRYYDAPDLVVVRHYRKVEQRVTWNLDSSIHFATPQMVYSRRRRAGIWQNVRLVIFDEAHLLLADTFRASVELVMSVASGAKALGLSATPGRSDEREVAELVSLFGGRLITSPTLGKCPVAVLRGRGVLARIEYRYVDVREVKGLVIQARAEWSLEGLIVVLTRLIKKLAAKDGRILVFAPSIDTCLLLEDVLNSIGVSAVVVSSRMGDRQRESVLDDFARSRCQVLVNVSVLATGYDCPQVTDVVLARPIESPILFEQIVGRVSRGPRVGGTTIGRVWDFFGSCHVHGDSESYERYGYEDWDDRKP